MIARREQPLAQPPRFVVAHAGAAYARDGRAQNGRPSRLKLTEAASITLLVTTTNSSSAPVLVLGELAAARLRPIEMAAAQARFDVHAERDASDAAQWLEHHRPPAIVVEGGTRRGEHDCIELRYRPHLARVPIVSAGEALDDLAFAETFACGGDDLCRRATSAVARRLRALASAGDPPPARRRGRAIVIDTDLRGRVLTGRVLRNAGYDVTFAGDAAEGLAASLEPGVELASWNVRAASELEGLNAPAEARRKRSGVHWVLGTAPKDLAAARGATRELADVAVFDAFGPPENLLFVANELSSGPRSNSRASQRLLYGTVVGFRPAGSQEDELGYTYNIGAAGFYVRTLAPPAPGTEIWAELCPPRTQRRVRLEAVVAWTRAFGPNDGATVPPGFGVQITGGSVADLERYTRGYRTFAAELSDA
jgi:CheY-like chemotaxis protein